jgi:hypothetical protein
MPSIVEVDLVRSVSHAHIQRETLVAHIKAPIWLSQILQGLRQLTRQKTFEVDVGMARR